MPIQYSFLQCIGKVCQAQGQRVLFHTKTLPDLAELIGKLGCLVQYMRRDTHVRVSCPVCMGQSKPVALVSAHIQSSVLGDFIGQEFGFVLRARQSKSSAQVITKRGWATDMCFQSHDQSATDSCFINKCLLSCTNIFRVLGSAESTLAWRPWIVNPSSICRRPEMSLCPVKRNVSPNVKHAPNFPHSLSQLWHLGIEHRSKAQKTRSRRGSTMIESVMIMMARTKFLADVRTNGKWIKVSV